MTGQRLPRTVAAACALASGLCLSFYPTLVSGFSAMQVEPLDTPLINYILEHSYLWITGDPLHGSFWSPPVFYPASNTAAYSETFLGTAPVYWLFRILGTAPDTSYQLWFIALAALNFLAAFVFLRRGLAAGFAGATAGAWLMAFGSPRTQQLIHAQLVPVFFVLIALYCLHRLFIEPATGGRFVAVFFAAVAVQLYTSFYVGWFLIFGLCLAVAMALAAPGPRSRLVAVFRQQRISILVCATLSAALIVPMLLRYLDAVRARGYREFGEVAPMLIRPQSWLYMGPDSWLYGGLADLGGLAALPMEHEHRLGVGLLTAAVSIAGLWLVRAKAIVRFTVATVVLMSALAMAFPGGFTAWELVFETVPGAAALRAVSRIGMLALIPLGIGLASVVDVLKVRGRWLPLILVIAVVFVEQGAGLPSYDKAGHRREVARLAAGIPARGDAFLHVAGYGSAFWRGQVIAMWAGTRTGKPTVNGYSGNVPPGWSFFEEVVNDDARRADALASWGALHGIDPERIVVVRSP